MGRQLRNIPIALIVAWSVGCHSAPANRSANVSQHITISTGVRGGNFYPVGLALAKAYTSAIPDLSTEVKATPGAMVNLDMLQKGETDLAFSFADVSYAAFIGRLNDRPERYTRLRAIALLQLEPVQVVISARSPVKTLKELRGHRVNYGGGGSGTAVTAEVLLKAYGVDSASVRAMHRPIGESIDALTDGSLDAMIVLARYPVDVVTQATAAGAHLIALAGAPVEQLQREYPFVRPMLIPADVYTGQKDAIQTIGINSLLLCREDLDEELVYRLTKTLFQSIDEERDGLLRSIDLQHVAVTPIPLHPGAARYYRERELFP